MEAEKFEYAQTTSDEWRAMNDEQRVGNDHERPMNDQKYYLKLWQMSQMYSCMLGKMLSIIKFGTSHSLAIWGHVAQVSHTSSIICVALRMLLRTPTNISYRLAIHLYLCYIYHSDSSRLLFLLLFDARFRGFGLAELTIL